MPTQSASGNQQTVLSRQTLVPVGAALGIIITLVVTTWNIAQTSTRIQEAINQNTQAVKDLQTEVSRINGSRWSRQDMADWIMILRNLNPNLKIPEVRSVR